MIRAVLLDLDNTLLANPDRAYVDAYLSLTEQYFAEIWNYHGMARLLRETTRRLTTPHDPQQSNRTLWLDTIAQATGHAPDEIDSAFRDFCSNAHQQLRTCAQSLPTARTLVDHFLESGYAVVIATNPIYPPEIIHQRLDWAGILEKLERFALVTTTENMHTAKPDPAYFAEILGRVGVEPDDAIVVGDSEKNDIRPATQIGIHTYHIHADTPANLDLRLREFLEQVSAPGWHTSFVSPPHAPSMVESQLRGNVGALFGLLLGVKDSFWSQHPDPDEWSVLETVCHLLESETKLQRPRLRRILDEENPFLVSPKASVHTAGPACDDDGYGIARRFAQERQATIDFLADLSPADWRRPARDSVFGPTNLLEMALFTAQHDRLHLNQICETMGKCV